MSILFAFILNIIFVSYVQSDLPSIICGYTGADGSYVFTYNIRAEEIPSCCQAVYYGGYYFNDTPRAQEAIDIANIRKANKPVWMMLMCQDAKELAEIACSKDTSALDKYLGPMAKYLNDNKIDGVFVSELYLHDGKIPGYSKVVETLLCRIKKCVPNVKLGLVVYGDDSDKFADKKIFDFTVTNPVVDFYVIETSVIAVECSTNENGKFGEGGKLPSNILEKVFNAVSGSAMDPNKIWTYALDYTVNKDGFLKPYSDYCIQKEPKGWCADTIKDVYDQAKFFKKHTKGMIIVFLDVDDYYNACECGLFPIANALMAGWEGEKMPTCAALC